MPTSTYDLIASSVLDSNAASVTFSSIPSTYRDLVLVASGKLSTGEAAIYMRLNSDTSKIYPYVNMTGSGTTAASASNSSSFSEFYLSNANWSATHTSNFIVNFFDYSVTDKHKPILCRANVAQSTGSAGVEAWAYRWGSTSAISTILVASENPAEPFASGASFYLYGIVS